MTPLNGEPMPTFGPLSPVQREAWAERRIPPVEEAAEGVWAIPVPFPWNPVKFTYSYLVESPSGAVLLDPGAAEPGSRAALDAAFAELDFDPSRLVGIVVSHYHVDHWSLADSLAADTGAWVALSRDEWAWMERLQDEELQPAAIERRLRQDWGVSAEAAAAIAATDDYGEYRAYARPDRLLAHGERLPLEGRDISVLLTPGHTPGHICLFDRDRRLLFSGDHLLPGITSNVSLNPFGHVDPLGAFLDGLELIEGLGVRQVLPAHEYRFAGAEERIERLREKVDERLDELRALGAQGEGSVWEVAQLLSWSRPWAGFTPQSQRLALGETAAYLRHLGRLPEAAPRD